MWFGFFYFDVGGFVMLRIDGEGVDMVGNMDVGIKFDVVD